MKRKLLLVSILTLSFLATLAQNNNIADAYLNYKVSRNVKGNAKQ